MSQSSTPPAFAAFVVAAPFGALGARAVGGALTEILFLPPETPGHLPDDPLAALFAREMAAYLADPAYRPQLPLQVRGTPFQQRVWQAIAAIPCGQTRRYGEIASELASAPRAVGQACGANPYPIVVPCHRVLGSQGIGGFAHARDGWLLATKQWLLRHEAAL